MVKIDSIKLEQFDTEKYEVPDFYTNLAQISVTKSDCTIIFKKTSPSRTPEGKDVISDECIVRMSIPVAKAVTSILTDMLGENE